MASSFPAFPSGSYEARVKDIKNHLQHVRKGLKAVEDRRSHVIELQEGLLADASIEIADREQAAVTELRETFDNERRRVTAALRPLEEDIKASDSLVVKFRDLVECVQDVCLPKRTTALVDRHSEIILAISDLSQSVEQYLSRPLNVESVREALLCCSESERTSELSDMIILGELHVREVDSILSGDCIRLYVEISDSCITPHFNIQVLSTDVTVMDLLEVLSARLGGLDLSSLVLLLKSTPTSSVLYPVHSSTSILQEVADFTFDEDSPGLWPRLFLRCKDESHRAVNYYRDA